jgi:signal recognition particle GTPase
MTPEEHAEELTEKLFRVRDRLATADTERASAMAQLRELVREGHGVIPIKHMADLAGVTRPTVYKMLEENQPK